MINNNSQGM